MAFRGSGAVGSSVFFFFKSVVGEGERRVFLAHPHPHTNMAPDPFHRLVFFFSSSLSSSRSRLNLAYMKRRDDVHHACRVVLGLAGGGVCLFFWSKAAEWPFFFRVSLSVLIFILF